MTLSRLFSMFDSAKVADWTPRRAHQAEREMLRAEGIVVEPHYGWSLPAQTRERQARINREQSWRKAFQRSPGAAKVAQFGRGRS